MLIRSEVSPSRACPWSMVHAAAATPRAALGNDGIGEAVPEERPYPAGGGVTAGWRAGQEPLEASSVLEVVVVVLVVVVSVPEPVPWPRSLAVATTHRL
jgi:hypothetical protein